MFALESLEIGFDGAHVLLDIAGGEHFLFDGDTFSPVINTCEQDGDLCLECDVVESFLPVSVG